MIHPLINFRIRGVIWYQGEGNTNRPYDYRYLFTGLISDWREKWGYEYPFYWVQLPNFIDTGDIPGKNSWAILRESQSQALLLPQTTQIVTVDIGDPP